MGLSAGNDTCFVTDSRGCIDTAWIDMWQPAAALSAIVYLVDSVTCFGGYDGVDTVDVTGGTQPYSFAFSFNLHLNK